MGLINKVNESVKVLILGIVIYISVKLFFKLGARWFEELEKKSNFNDRALLIKKHFWTATLQTGLILLTGVYLISDCTYLEFWHAHSLKLIGVFIALNASLGRGGWQIQSAIGDTIVERIDYGFFKISQLGTTVIFLMLLNE